MSVFFILHWCKRVLAHFEISLIEFLSVFRSKKIMKIGHFLCYVTSMGVFRGGPRGPPPIEEIFALLNIA